MGTLIPIEFFAPENMEELSKQPLEVQAKAEIKYDYKNMPSDLELLATGRDQEFCYKQCLKMAYYMQIVRKVQLLTMQAEFYKDDLGYIWFFYAKDIYVKRPIELPNNL